MRSRPRKTPANDSKTRQTKRRAADAQSGAVKSAGHQGAETSDGAQPEADVARDAADAAATAQTGPERAGDEPGDGVETLTEGEEAKDVSRETGQAETAAAPGDAQTERPEGQTPAASEVPAGPTLDIDAAVVLKRLREQPLCCCGCGQVLSNPKRHFSQGHDSKAKVIVRKIMRGELLPQDAPPELILRHSESKFIMRSPEFRRVAEMWREICGLTLGRAAGN